MANRPLVLHAPNCCHGQDTVHVLFDKSAQTCYSDISSIVLNDLCRKTYSFSWRDVCFGFAPLSDSEHSTSLGIINRLTDVLSE